MEPDLHLTHREQQRARYQDKHLQRRREKIGHGAKD
ncbi:hypothetical protein PR003_g1036 [Phytophthora rubi]|uniref:Uncharacterized protein n=1 Tax=Phytophthora rubi TaxID=129364 RepID=A0A6A3P4U9_9STRA|nr:hypothetical protein PR002_g960 [Phytophthora rubi]KAE9358923.1 hypothetical protein PR003_g1036 [Phytophthora rubi]